MSQLKLSIATTDYDHVRDLTLGRVQPEGIDLTILNLPIEEFRFADKLVRALQRLRGGSRHDRTAFFRAETEPNADEFAEERSIAATIHEAIRFSPEKMTKIHLFESPRMFVDLYCLRAGQEQRVHSHADADKVYHVLSGEGLTGGPSGRGVAAAVNAENPVTDYGPQKIADIRALGPANVVLTTDLGQPDRVNYAVAFQMALTVLAKEGFSQAEIDLMTKQNPARFLGLK